MKLRPYKKGDQETYAIGVFATLELLIHKPDVVIHVFLHSKGEKNEGVGKIKMLCEKHHIEISYDNKLIETLSKSENTYALGLFKKYESRITNQENHVVLVNPSDSGNVGTIIRTAIGFSMKNLVIINPGVDVFDPKVIRASQGALFQMSFSSFNSFGEYAKVFKHNPYPFMLDGKESLEEVHFKTPYALIFGNEGAGLDDWFTNMGTSVRIPQSDSIDSLNIAVSVGLGLYKAYTQK
jgi:TrmH family RNA methyltransferase